MRKILSILAILVATITIQAKEVTIEKTNFSDGTTQLSASVYNLDDDISMSLAGTCTVPTSGEYLSIK